MCHGLLAQVDVEIKYEDLDDIDDDESDSDVDAVRARARRTLAYRPVTLFVVPWQDALFQLEESPHVEDAAYRFVCACVRAVPLALVTRRACLTGPGTQLAQNSRRNG